MNISLDLKCFRQHKDLHIDFTPGLNVIRGVNESGKSTLLEAMCYARYGSKALRNSLDKVVTWGHDQKELKVVDVVQVGEVTYTFSRSKGGAECNWAGGKVTGQAEVTKFACDLFGADEKTASLLMLSSQSGLRGALEAGPAKVSELMSNLADFALIDKVLDVAAVELLLGSEKPYSERLAETERGLTDLQAQRPNPSAIPVLAAEIETLTQSLASHTSHIESVLEPALDAAAESLDGALQHNASRGRALQNVQTLQAKLATEQSKLAAAQVEAAARADASAIPSLQARLDAITSHAALVEKYKKFAGMPPYPTQFWEGPVEGLKAEMATLAARINKCTGLLGELAGEINAKKRQILTKGNCPTCGQAVNADDHVAARNAELKQEIFMLELNADALTSQAAAARAELTTLNQVDASGQSWDRLAAELGDLVTVDRTNYPAVVAWAGAAPGEVEAAAPIRREIAAINETNAKADQAQGRVTVHTATIAEVQGQISQAEAVVATLPAIDTAPLEAAHAAALATCQQHGAVRREKEAELAAKVTQRDEITRAVESHDERVRAIQARMAELRKDIDDLAFNNGFVKKLKLIKPMITDRLWGMVLAAVSTYFSTMRGVTSVVTKGADGFKINDQDMDSFSGSTIDVLALAVRVALTKTFLPNTSFLTLDEPAHGCDDNRTSQLLGFLTSAGMAQIILASHDKLSEAVADNVISLGGES